MYQPASVTSVGMSNSFFLVRVARSSRKFDFRRAALPRNQESIDVQRTGQVPFDEEHGCVSSSSISLLTFNMRRLHLTSCGKHHHVEVLPAMAWKCGNDWRWSSLSRRNYILSVCLKSDAPSVSFDDRYGGKNQ